MLVFFVYVLKLDILQIGTDELSSTMCQLRYFERNFPHEPIKMLISFQNFSDDCGAFIDCMQHTKRVCDIHTYGHGRLHAESLLTLASGTVGHRYITRSTCLGFAENHYAVDVSNNSFKLLFCC